ncbi:hypothetical protein ABI59_17025 [Acidobacteria bacterium Mor1]|nr:hypothetical protein ABI59_17025 [Acidobacteria bacterium Mor1]
MRFPLLLLLVLMMPPAGAAGPTPEEAREWLEGWLSRPHAPPSISVAIAEGDEVVLAEAVGLADIEGGVAATPATTYRTYSISKGITAVGVMQLIEHGSVSLENELHRLVPRYPKKRWPIRVEHLLAHTSGIRHYKKNAGEISSTVEYPSLTDSLAVFKDDPLLFEPGTSKQYSTFGFNLLTGVIEQASGRSYGDYLATRVFEPAGMESSNLAIAGEEEASAQAYWRPRKPRGKSKRIKKLPNVSGRYGASGIVSTPTDLVRLFIALRGGKLMRPETFERMLSVPYPEADPDQAYGWNLDRQEGRFAVYRSGAGTGFTGALVHYPERNITIALLVNQNQYKERWELLDALAGRYLGSDGER